MSAERLDPLAAAYISDVFGRAPADLASITPRAIAAGIPDISITPEVGRLLQILASLSGGRRLLEIGALAGHSACWLAHGLTPGGILHTIELDAKHAAFARDTFARVGLAERIKLHEGHARDIIPHLMDRHGRNTFDMLFIDAEKTEYAEYWRLARPLLRVGGILAVDNALSSGWQITDAPGTSIHRDAVDAFNRAIAADPSLVSTIIPLRAGVLVAQIASEQPQL